MSPTVYAAFLVSWFVLGACGDNNGVDVTFRVYGNSTLVAVREEGGDWRTPRSTDGRTYKAALGGAFDFVASHVHARFARVAAAGDGNGSLGSEER